MARIIVKTDLSDPREALVLLEESVSSVHLSTAHAAAQLVERLAWAVADAENAEGARAEGARADRREPARTSGALDLAHA
jgi:thiazole synthase ThiGH ThiG subunit